MSELDDLAKRVQELEAQNRRLKGENVTYQTNLESLVKARTDQLQAALHNLERSYDTTLETLGDALELKNGETTGHSRRATAFSIGIAQALGLPREKIAVIARGAFLHDIGKMAIPDRILLKPGQLDPEEMRVMREHPSTVIESLRRFHFFKATLLRLSTRITSGTTGVATHVVSKADKYLWEQGLPL
jgi:cyclic di-GMP phosphodiesterase